MTLKSLREVKVAIQAGASLIQSQEGRFSLKTPGAAPLAVDVETGKLLLEHPIVERLGPDSKGGVCYGVSCGNTFDGSQAKPVQR